MKGKIQPSIIKMKYVILVNTGGHTKEHFLISKTIQVLKNQ